jgi:hypothetical protein
MQRQLLHHLQCSLAVSPPSALPLAPQTAFLAAVDALLRQAETGPPAAAASAAAAASPAPGLDAADSPLPLLALGEDPSNQEALLCALPGLQPLSAAALLAPGLPLRQLLLVRLCSIQPVHPRGLRIAGSLLVGPSPCAAGPPVTFCPHPAQVHP